jgi:hypothetical protein
MAPRRPKFIPPADDPTAWLLDSGVAEFLLMNTLYIKYMCLLAYTYLHGTPE